MNEDGSNFYSGHFFESPLNLPTGSMLLHSNGRLYGLASAGGKYENGSLFSLNPDGSDFTVLFDFERNSSGGRPETGLIEGANGLILGVLAANTGTNTGGLFQINEDGSGYSVLYEFGENEWGGTPGKLLMTSDGWLYGITGRGGAAFEGTLYRISPQGTGFTILHEFTDLSGSNPSGELLEHSNGKLYGTTTRGGDSLSSRGVIFRINKDGTGYEVLKSFDQKSEGQSPQSPLVMDNQGNLFGVAVGGGLLNGGLIFSCDSIGDNFQVLHDFELNDLSGLFLPRNGLLKGNDGKLYGTCSAEPPSGFFDGAIFRINTDGTGFEAIKLLASESGSNPYSTLIQDNNGTIFGNTKNGGGDDKGIIFRMDANGNNYSALVDFSTTSDGLGPQGSLILASNNQTYGVTSGGGEFGRGVVFTTDEYGGNYKIVHSFNGSDGANPVGTLLEGADGYLYGVTTEGGSADLGVVFKIDVAGNSYTLLHEFDSVSTSQPTFGLVQLPDGTLVGTTPEANFFDPGTLYSLQPDGTNFTVIDTFETSGQPYGIPLLHSNGRIYGASFSGIWQYLPGDDSIQVFSPFLGGGVDLLEGSDQMMYGMTMQGGANSAGTIFKFNPDGSGYTVIHSFDLFNGSYPEGGLIERSDGLLYGMTTSGGNPGGSAGLGAGTVFRIAKDGTGYEVIKFLNNGLGTEPTGNLLVVPGTNSVTSPLASFNLSVFPNPTQERITLQTDIETGGTIQFVDLQGRSLLQQTLAVGERSANLDLSRFPAGTYIVVVASGGDVARKKVVKW